MLSKTPERTYLDAVERYITNLSYQGRSPKTLSSYRKVLDRFYSFWREMHPEGAESGPTFSDVEEWRNRMMDAGTQPSSVGQYLVTLRYFFAAMSDEELGEERVYEKNPVLKRLIPTVKKRPYEALLTPEQTAALFDNQRTKGSQAALWPRNYAMVVLMLTTGIRQGELIALTPRDLEWDEEEEYGLLTIQHGKGDKFRQVDLPRIAWLAIQLYLESGLRPEEAGEDEPLFGVNRGGWHQLNGDNLSQMVERHVYTVTGVRGIRTHDLRHVFARAALTSGTPMELLQGELGHSSLTTTQIYSGRLTAKRQMKGAARIMARREAAERELAAALEIRSFRKNGRQEQIPAEAAPLLDEEEQLMLAV